MTEYSFTHRQRYMMFHNMIKEKESKDSHKTTIMKNFRVFKVYTTLVSYTVAKQYRTVLFITS